jgi:hypothetical protein
MEGVVLRPENARGGWRPPKARRDPRGGCDEKHIRNVFARTFSGPEMPKHPAMPQDPLQRILRVRTLLLITVALAACDYGGSPSGSVSAANVQDPNPAPVAAALTWEEATGPVTGYRVWESRNGGIFRRKNDVSEAEVRVEGMPGDTLQVQVAAFDAQGNTGPRSDPSDTLVFEDSYVSVAPPAAQALANTGSEGGTVSALAAPLPSDVVTDGLAAIDDDPAGTTVGDDGDALAEVRLDMSGDGISDLLWESVEGDLLRVTDSDRAVVATFDRPAEAWSLVAMADIDGDGLTDLLWAQDSGALALSRMGLSLPGQPVLDLTAVGTLGEREQIPATGDFDGDGASEVLVQDSDSGALSVWSLAPGAAPVVEALGLAPALGQVVAGSRDYDGDDRDDLLLQGTDGALTVWLLDSAGFRAQVTLGVAAGGEVLASGDFDGDGVDDVARRDANGGVELLMLGAGFETPAVVAGLATGAELERAGSGDFDGDGRSDLLWRAANGDLVAWLMNPGLAIEVVTVAPDAGWNLIADWR